MPRTRESLINTKVDAPVFFDETSESDDRSIKAQALVERLIRD